MTWESPNWPGLVLFECSGWCMLWKQYLNVGDGNYNKSWSPHSIIFRYEQICFELMYLYYFYMIYPITAWFYVSMSRELIVFVFKLAAYFLVENLPCASEPCCNQPLPLAAQVSTTCIMGLILHPRHDSAYGPEREWLTVWQKSMTEFVF